MKLDREFEQLLKNPLFMSQLISIIIDEAHCLTDWGEFHPEYRELGRLRYILLSTLPLLVISATITKSTMNDITRLLHMQKDRTVVYRWSSDCPNVKIGVRKIKYALSSFTDLMFLILAGFKVGDPLPPKFLVFFDNIPDSIKAVAALRQRLPPKLRDKIKWFNTNMSSTFKEEELENIVSGETWGFCTMTSFGMVCTMQILRWLLTPRANREWMFSISCWSFSGEQPVEQQRFGRAARDQGLVGTALLLAEKEYFNDEKAAKAVRKACKEAKRKRTADEANLPGAACQSKCAAVSSDRQATNGGSRSHLVHSFVSQLNDGVEGVANSSDEESDRDEGKMVGADALVQIPLEPASSLEALLEAVIKEKSSKFNSTSSKWRKRDLDPAINYLINAKKGDCNGC